MKLTKRQAITLWNLFMDSKHAGEALVCAGFDNGKGQDEEKATVAILRAMADAIEGED